MLIIKLNFFFLKKMLQVSRTQLTFAERERKWKILKINSPKQKSLRSAKEHLSKDSLLFSSGLTEKQNYKLCSFGKLNPKNKNYFCIM